MTITAEQAREFHKTVGGIQTPMMQGDCLAVVLCSFFDDGEPNEDSDNGWSTRAEDGYEEVIAAIRAHYDPAIRTVIAQAEELARVKADLAKAVVALTEMNVGEGWAARVARAALKEITHD